MRIYLSHIFIRFWIVILFTVIANTVNLRSGQNSSIIPDSSLQVGEELVYNVRYAFLDIGQIRVKVTGKVQDGNRIIYKSISYIDSYPDIPFIDLHSVFESDIEESLYSVGFKGRNKSNSNWFITKYKFDYENKKFYFEHTTTDNPSRVKRDSLPLDKFCQDGLSLLFFARKYAHLQEKIDVLTVINEKFENTFINFSSHRTSAKIDAVDYPVDVVYLNGRAEFVGIFGFTGKFEGWFSNDVARVPILAKMKVIIGSITIELMKWKRAGWQPPRARHLSNE